VPPCHNSRVWDAISSVQWHSYGEFYDLTVPHAHHYAANGLWHHNSGKTTANAMKAFIYALSHPGAHGCLTCHTYTQVWDNLMPVINDKFGELPGWTTRRGPPPEINFANGSKILLRPAAEPGKLQGLNLAFFGMDEVAVKDQQMAFMVLIERLRQPGYPQQGWVTTTPHWRRPWIRMMWQEKMNPTTKRKLPEGDYPIFRASTFKNVFLRHDYASDITAAAPSQRYLRQQLYGEFIDVSGVAFEDFSERTHVRKMPEGAKVVKRAIGVDFGMSAPTAVIEMCLLDNGEIQGTYEFYKPKCDEREMVEAIASRPRCKVLCDPSDTMHIESLKKYGINAHPSKAKGFEHRFKLWAARVKLMNRSTGKIVELGAPGSEFARPGIYLSPDMANTINEIENLAFGSDRNDEPQDRWEHGLYDHGFDAGAYALSELDPAIFRIEPLRVSLPAGWR